jgi:hypothetical protein
MSLVNDKVINRPTCCNRNCDRLVHLINYSATGTPKYRPYCGQCHLATMGKKPFKEGVEPIKKTFCENSDSRLGFSCATNGETLHSCMLDLDHIDGDHYHNVEKNIQTLCKNCHSYKTKMNGDNRTGW